MPARFSQGNKPGRTRTSTRGFESKQNLLGYLKILVDIEMGLKKKAKKVDTPQTSKILETQHIS